MGCGECGFFQTGCDTQDDNAPCVIERRKKQVIKKQEAEEIPAELVEECVNGFGPSVAGYQSDI